MSDVPDTSLHVRIRSAFEESWLAARAAYSIGHVNSECTLHALLYAELRQRLSDCVVLCEPQINVERHGCFVPDLVVLKESSVVAIAEVKFAPHGYVVYELDLRKLTILSEWEGSFPLLLAPSSGKFADGQFVISPDCVMVFAAVAKHDAAAVHAPRLETSMSTLGKRFLPLVLGIGQRGPAEFTAQA